MGRTRLAMYVAMLVAGSVLTVASPAAADDSTPNADITYVDDSVGADPVSDLSAESVDATEAASPLPGDCPVVFHSGWGEGCFHRHGDRVYVVDTNDNNHAAYVYFENYLRTSSGNWKKRVWGTCTPYLVGVVSYCAFNFYEDTTLNVYGGHGSGVRIYICQKSSGCDATYSWVRNNR